MEIYSIGKSGKTIDVIVERLLHAYIAETGKYAVVTVDDDERDVTALCESKGIDEVEEKHISFFFSPTKLVCGMDYILATEIERESYDILISAFKQKFYNQVIKEYEDGDKITRAEAVRLIWSDFNHDISVPYDNVDEEELERLINVTDNSLVEKLIVDKFIELIIRYSIYITMWEQKYSSHEANKLIDKRIQRQIDREIEIVAPDRKTIKNRFLFLLTGEPKMTRIKDHEYIISKFTEDEMVLGSADIQEKIYEELSIHNSIKMDRHNKFFVNSKKERIVKGKELKTVYTSLTGLLLFINYIDYRILNRKKKMEFFLEDDFVGDISSEIEAILDAAIEIVLMMNIFINDEKFENLEDNLFVKKTMELHINVLPVVKYLMGLEDMSIDIKERLKEIDTVPNIRLIIKNNAKKRIKKLKDENYGATIIGGYYMYASSDNEILEGTKYNDVRARAKRREKDYWEKRYQCLKKWQFPDSYQLNEEYINRLMKYLYIQNQEIHNHIRKILNIYVEQKL